MAEHLTLVAKGAAEPPEPNAALIAMLEGLLDAAVEGRLRSLAWSGAEVDGFTFDFAIEEGDEAAIFMGLAQAGTVIRENLFE